VVRVTYADALNAVHARLSTASAAHCVRVAATARELAVVYGADPDLAELAGLLHDWDRDVPTDSLVAAAAEAGIAATPADEAVPYLLHARTAAAALKEALPGLPEPVLTAVARHTVGAVDMNCLDMVVYLADMIEPGRAYPGVDDLREAVGRVPLDELFALGYQQSLTYLVTSRRRIHPDTVDVWNALVAGGAQ
jgi:predicted HD superfamily hydrolase involved in NAD metabolism